MVLITVVVVVVIVFTGTGLVIDEGFRAVFDVLADAIRGRSGIRSLGDRFLFTIKDMNEDVLTECEYIILNSHVGFIFTFNFYGRLRGLALSSGSSLGGSLAR